MEGLGFNEESKAVISAAVKSEETGREEDTEMLDASETKRIRSLAATLNYMSSDRSDVQYAAKEVCTKLACGSSVSKSCTKSTVSRQRNVSTCTHWTKPVKVAKVRMLYTRSGSIVILLPQKNTNNSKR